MRLHTIQQGNFGLGFFVTALRWFLLARTAFLNAVQIGQNQLGIYDFNIADRIDRVHNVLDVDVFETAQHLDNGVDLTDMAEKLISQTFTLACAPDQSCNIDELKDRGNYFD